MCFMKVPEPKPLPTPPRPDDPSVLARQQLELQRLDAQGGTANNVKTDLDPAAIAGKKRVALGM